jgi:hypothetical protein
MRVGDFGVDVAAVRDGEVREIESGHVLARVGTVYGLRLVNFGPLRCVADVKIDGKPVTAGGLVLDAYGVTTLERPIHDRERGRFTVIAEGDERVFGPDGGRDNPDLGVIDARFRRELPRERDVHYPDLTTLPVPARRMTPPEWSPPGLRVGAAGPPMMNSASVLSTPTIGETMRPSDLIERAAGTGLTGHSSQEFVPVSLGPLEKEATVIRLRIVIGNDAAFAEARPLPEANEAPARPAARP